MVLLNAAKMARHAAVVVNRTNVGGGGSKKAGLPFRIGWFLQSNYFMVGAPQSVPLRTNVSFTIQTQRYGYAATLGPN